MCGAECAQSAGGAESREQGEGNGTVAPRCLVSVSGGGAEPEAERESTDPLLGFKREHLNHN